MRKEARTQRTANITECHHYHGTYVEGELQANSFEGGAKYFASDRAKALADVITARGYGLEMEMTSRLTRDSRILATILNAELKAHMPLGFFKFERDCTVDIECITQVATKAFWRNHYAAMKAVYQYLKTIQTFPNAGGQDCGMHVNISIANFGKDDATQRANIMKLHKWINESNESYKFACAMVHRDIHHTDWCGRMNADYLNDDGSHGACMNYSHMNEGRASRVEIRLVGAQQTFGNWRNTMETIFWLVKQSKELSAKDWNNAVKLWSGCNQYVFDRLTDAVAIYGTINAADYETIRANVKREELV